MKLYIAGKIAKESTFGTHYWRDDFCKNLSERTGLELELVDPIKGETGIADPWNIFVKDCRMIADCDLFIVFLSDDISVGGSQEILIAKYFNKPVIGYAPYKGKFNGATRKMFGKTVTDYKHPFVFSTCDRVCGTEEEVTEAVKDYRNIKVESLEGLLQRAVLQNSN